MSEIKTVGQAISWCNNRLLECASSGSDYYQSLFEVRDILAGAGRENADLRVKTDRANKDKEIFCNQMDVYRRGCETLEAKLEKAERKIKAREKFISLKNAMLSKAYQERDELRILFQDAYLKVNNLECDLEKEKQENKSFCDELLASEKQLQKELDEAQEQAEELQLKLDNYEDMRNSIQKLSQMVVDKDATIASLRGALGFYADENNYEMHGTTDGIYTRWGGEEVQCDKGKIARQALAATPSNRFERIEQAAKEAKNTFDNLQNSEYQTEQYNNRECEFVIAMDNLDDALKREG